MYSFHIKHSLAHGKNLSWCITRTETTNLSIVDSSLIFFLASNNSKKKLKSHLNLRHLWKFQGMDNCSGFHLHLCYNLQLNLYLNTPGEMLKRLWEESFLYLEREAKKRIPDLVQTIMTSLSKFHSRDKLNITNSIFLYWFIIQLKTKDILKPVLYYHKLLEDTFLIQGSLEIPEEFSLW